MAYLNKMNTSICCITIQIAYTKHSAKCGQYKREILNAYCIIISST